MILVNAAEILVCTPPCDDAFRIVDASSPEVHCLISYTLSDEPPSRSTLVLLTATVA